MSILLLAIFGPGVLAVIFTRYLDHIVRNKPSWVETLSFDYRSLFKQPWFWLVSISGLLYTLVFMGIAVFDRKVLLTSEGFKNFINDAQLSLGILSAFSLLLLLISRIHTSYQSEKQIIELEQKNNVDLYFTLKDRYISEISEIYIKNYSRISMPRYKSVSFNTIGFAMLFTGSPSSGKPLLRKRTVTRICKRLMDIQNCIKALMTDGLTDEEYFRKLLAVNYLIKRTHRLMGIEEGEPVNGIFWGSSITENTKNWIKENKISDYGIQVITYEDIRIIVEIYQFLFKSYLDVIHEQEITYGDSKLEAVDDIIENHINYVPSDNETLKRIGRKYLG